MSIKENSPIIELKKNLKKMGIFDDKTLNTLKYSKINNCNMCNTSCGSIAKLTECINNINICLNCIDDMYDNYHVINNDNNILFKCLCCNNDILNYTIE